MKQERSGWLVRGGVLLLLAGAMGLLIWQGAQHASSTEKHAAPQRLAAVTETETTAETSAAETAKTVLTTDSVPKETKAKTKSTAKTKQTAAAVRTVEFPLELNCADASELEQLPGIGAALAERIVDYRSQIGGFRNREQLMEVSGIGEAKLSAVYDLVYVENESDPEDVQEPEIVPEQEAPASAAVPELPAETQPEPEPELELPLDLNRATEEELVRLPDEVVSPELAAQIVAFREQIGAFSSVYELLYVEGVTEKKFTELRDYVQIIEESAP